MKTIRQGYNNLLCSSECGIYGMMKTHEYTAIFNMQTLMKMDATRYKMAVHNPGRISNCVTCYIILCLLCVSLLLFLALYVVISLYYYYEKIVKQ